ncbi:MAG: stage II sporulation protein P [Bacillota bacterium]
MKRCGLLAFYWLFFHFLALANAETIHQDHQPGVYYTIVDSATNNVLLETGLETTVGDEFITEDNKLYHISRLVGYLAYADYVREETAQAWREALALPASNGVGGKLISLYHSHTDESYIPSDGTASIRGNGSIMKVGDAFAEKLRSLGYTVNHDKTSHDPHDANAYIRSRRTAVRLLGAQPAALFDIHRDSAPVTGYRLAVNNELYAKVVIVVGRANPYMPTTLDYAKRLKAATDAQYPQLIRGIFFARGHYNQDINPRNILIEIGTEGLTLDESQKSASLFAESIPAVLGGPQDPTPGVGSAEAAPPGKATPAVFNDNSVPWRNLLWLVGIAAVGGIAYLYISAGSWRSVWQKLSQLRGLEFTNLCGLRFFRKGKRHPDSDKE